VIAPILVAASAQQGDEKMFKRTAIVLATMLAVLMTVGVGLAATSTPDTSSSTTTSTTPTTSIPDADEAQTVIYEVGDAGTVTVSSDGISLSIVAVGTNEGWTEEVEASAGREVEADFRHGATRIQFNAELEDGEIKVRVRERATDSDDAGTTSTTTPDETSTTTSIPSDDSATATATFTFDAGAGGHVKVTSNGSSLTVVTADAAAGWSEEIEVSSGPEVEVDFRSGDRRIQFKAELEDGEIRIRIRDRVSESGDDNSGHDDDDDNSGHNDDDDDDDNSGHDDGDDDHGHGDDDDE